MEHDPVARIRRFNRIVTLTVGALDSSFLGRGRPLGVARVLALVTVQGTSVADIRTALKLDSGLLSRILRGLQGDGLVAVDPDPADRRHRIARLTAAGQAEQGAYDRLNELLAAGMLDRLSHDTAALLLALDRIAHALNRDRITFTVADPEGQQARDCLQAYFDLLLTRIPGVTQAHVPLPDPDASSYRAPDGAFLLAWSEGLAVGCVSLKRVDDHKGEVKRLWIEPAARGLGLARRMMLAVEDTARDLGMTCLQLDTNENLPEAIALYRATGWTGVAPFTGFPATHWFEKPL